MDRTLPLVSLSEIELRLGYNRSTILRWEKSKLIREGVHFFRPGKGHRRYDVPAMVDFVENNSREEVDRSAEALNLLRAIALSAQTAEDNQCLVPTILIDAIRTILRVKRSKA